MYSAHEDALNVKHAIFLLEAFNPVTFDMMTHLGYPFLCVTKTKTHSFLTSSTGALIACSLKYPSFMRMNPPSVVLRLKYNGSSARRTYICRAQKSGIGGPEKSTG